MNLSSLIRLSAARFDDFSNPRIFLTVVRVPAHQFSQCSCPISPLSYDCKLPEIRLKN